MWIFANVCMLMMWEREERGKKQMSKCGECKSLQLLLCCSAFSSPQVVNFKLSKVILLNRHELFNNIIFAIGFLFTLPVEFFVLVQIFFSAQCLNRKGICAWYRFTDLFILPLLRYL